MLRRAIDFMEERGIYAELPAYTSYDWMGGTITAVTTGSSGVVLLTLSNELSAPAPSPCPPAWRSMRTICSPPPPH